MVVTREIRFALDVNRWSLFSARERSRENWFFFYLVNGRVSRVLATRGLCTGIANRHVIFPHNSQLLTSRRHFSWGTSHFEFISTNRVGYFFLLFFLLFSSSFTARLCRVHFSFFSLFLLFSFFLSFLLPSSTCSRMLLYIFAYTHVHIHILAAACKYANDVYADTYTNSATGCCKGFRRIWRRRRGRRKRTWRRRMRRRRSLGKWW